ncbi:hypothetical protein EV207_10586 [Scopulibacillus darangshiensis]|uniref:Uncharacterized protein n=1 Tax=Scopulibacillus darangshiensis TaxID=442528 RepID=A0A4R2P710_9BACL|nr:sporulation protein [Scopulibacillus darangshiensis]TCP30557.1 hypothetical protein EV207_10586 [Scopulibacillus darangshiensis]
MAQMFDDHTLDYLMESLSNWIDDDVKAVSLYRQLVAGHYPDEKAFVESLSEEEQLYLNGILTKEMDYAKTGQDDVRLTQLNEVYERLF